MRVAIFDIDGTLTNTNEVDSDCFVKAFAESLAITPINSNWDEYPHTSDSGITDDIFQKRLGRAPTAAELTKLKTFFVSLLKGRYRSDSANFTEISCFFFSSRRRHTRSTRDWSSDVCSSD